MAASGYHGIVLDRLAKQAAELLDVEESCIFARDLADPSMAIVAAVRGDDEATVGNRVPLGPDLSTTRHGAQAQLFWEGEVQGSLSVGNVTTRPRLASTDARLLDAFAPMVAAAIWHAHERAATHPDLRHHIASLAAALDERDGYTARHSQEVVANVSSIGRAMGMDRASLAELEVAALMHDIGKILVPDSILKKPGRLTPDEHALMAIHPARGAEILARVPGLEVVATIVRYHHERWDGAGYPEGLAGERIPLASRIIAVCDSYNAMTSDRPYRRAMSQADALAQLDEGAHGQFDPSVVEGAWAHVWTSERDDRPLYPYEYTPSSHALSAASRAAASMSSTNRCALIPTTLP
jgi:HD-GYP domain-containing protein (c-di-GMP phosphodiesterase class II)